MSGQELVPYTGRVTTFLGDWIPTARREPIPAHVVLDVPLQPSGLPGLDELGSASVIVAESTIGDEASFSEVVTEVSEAVGRTARTIAVHAALAVAVALGPNQSNVKPEPTTAHSPVEPIQ